MKLILRDLKLILSLTVVILLLHSIETVAGQSNGSDGDLTDECYVGVKDRANLDYKLKWAEQHKGEYFLGMAPSDADQVGEYGRNRYYCVIEPLNLHLVGFLIKLKLREKVLFKDNKFRILDPKIISSWSWNSKELETTPHIRRENVENIYLYHIEKVLNEFPTGALPDVQAAILNEYIKKFIYLDPYKVDHVFKSFLKIVTRHNEAKKILEAQVAAAIQDPKAIPRVVLLASNSLDSPVDDQGLQRLWTKYFDVGVYEDHLFYFTCCLGKDITRPALINGLRNLLRSSPSVLDKYKDYIVGWTRYNVISIMADLVPDSKELNIKLIRPHIMDSYNRGGSFSIEKTVNSAFRNAFVGLIFEGFFENLYKQGKIGKEELDNINLYKTVDMPEARRKLLDLLYGKKESPSNKSDPHPELKGIFATDIQERAEYSASKGFPDIKDLSEYYNDILNYSDLRSSGGRKLHIQFLKILMNQLRELYDLDLYLFEYYFSGQGEQKELRKKFFVSLVEDAITNSKNPFHDFGYPIATVIDSITRLHPSEAFNFSRDLKLKVLKLNFVPGDRIAEFRKRLSEENDYDQVDNPHFPWPSAYFERAREVANEIVAGSENVPNGIEFLFGNLGNLSIGVRQGSVRAGLLQLSAVEKEYVLRLLPYVLGDDYSFAYSHMAYLAGKLFSLKSPDSLFEDLNREMVPFAAPPFFAMESSSDYALIRYLVSGILGSQFSTQEAQLQRIINTVIYENYSEYVGSKAFYKVEGEKVRFWQNHPEFVRNNLKPYDKVPTFCPFVEEFRKIKNHERTKNLKNLREAETVLDRLAIKVGCS